MKNITILASAALMFAACSEPLQEAVEINNNTNEPEKVGNSISHWGNKIEDPYTVENMRRAYDELTKDDTQSLTKKGLQKVQITPTHLHLKFIPKNEDEWRILKLDTVLNVVPIPFDYDLEGFDGNYRDPECPAGQPTYQYSVVRIGYPLPNVEYEVLDSLFMPFEDEYEQPSIAKKAGMRQIWDELEIESMKLTGNWEDDDENNILAKKKRITPGGQVLMTDFSNYGEEKGVPNVRIHMNFSTHTTNAITDKDGNWKAGRSFRSRVHSHVFFENSNYFASDEKGNEIGWYRGRVKLEGDEVFIMNKCDIHNYAATIMIAGYDYFNNELKAHKPTAGKRICIGLKNKIGQRTVIKTTQYGAHYKDSSDGNKEKVYIQNIYGDNMSIYATTIYGLAYSSLKSFAKVFNPYENDLLNESYLACVAYVFSNAKYGTKYKPEDYRKDYHLQNSGFFIDMIDGIDEYNLDYVKDYKLEQIESLINTKSIRVLRDVVSEMPKAYSNSTASKLEDLDYHWLMWADGKYYHN